MIRQKVTYMNKIIKHIIKINLRSIYLNFRLLPFAQALKFPLFISHNVKIHSLPKRGNLKILGNITPGMIQIGYLNLGTLDYSRDLTILQLNKDSHINFYGKCSIGCGSNISVNEKGTLDIGKCFNITGKSSIICSKTIQFGSDVLISWDCLIMDTDFHKLYINGVQTNKSKPIIIGNKVWIGCRCTILKGGEIPDGCVIGANSLISKKLESNNTLYAGYPIKALKDNILWEI